MLTPSSEIIQLLTTFAPAFSQPTFAKVLLLIYGAILAPGKRTVTSMLRVLGKEQEANFGDSQARLPGQAKDEIHPSIPLHRGRCRA